MKRIDFVFVEILVLSISLASFFLEGCSPAAIKIAEEVIEEVAAEELKGA